MQSHPESRMEIIDQRVKFKKQKKQQKERNFHI
jgi:hypothetical protein